MPLLRVLCVGDIVGSGGREAFEKLLPDIQAEHEVDFTIVNLENAAAGFGITPKVYHELAKSPVDAFTSGNHIYDKKAILPVFDTLDKLIPPYNFPPGHPGVGYRIVSYKAYKIAVVNLIGRVFMGLSDCPFQAIHRLLPLLAKETSMIFVDFHAEATSEKQAMGHTLDGKVSGVFGTHTHVQTADEQVLKKGTAYITDLGMVGPQGGILGMEPQPIVKRFFNQMPTRFEPAETDQLLFSAVCITVDTTTGQAQNISRISRLINRRDVG